MEITATEPRCFAKTLSMTVFVLEKAKGHVFLAFNVLRLFQ